MSKRKERERAEAGNRFINQPSKPGGRFFVCANCHKKGDNFVKDGNYWYHPDCPKKMVPFAEGEKIG